MTEAIILLVAVLALLSIRQNMPIRRTAQVERRQKNQRCKLKGVLLSIRCLPVGLDFCWLWPRFV